MILYLDASALVKQYVNESGSEAIETAVSQARSIGTALISHTEVAAAIAKLARLNLTSPETAMKAIEAFRDDWPSLIRIPITESLVAQAADLAWQHGLRGYDAVHLAAALTWCRSMESPALLATFDRQLWLAARRSGLAVLPSDLVLT